MKGLGLTQTSWMRKLKNIKEFSDFLNKNTQEDTELDMRFFTELTDKNQDYLVE